MSDQMAEGQRVLVTAGAAGIGRAMVDALVEAGARVHVCDVAEPALATLRAELPSVSCTLADVSDESDVDRLFDEVRRGWAGSTFWSTMPGSPARPQRSRRSTPADWRRCLEVDLTGQFLCARRAVPLLKAAGGGVMVNMSSSAGRLGYAFRTPYSAAKWGVIGLTQSLAKELGPAQHHRQRDPAGRGPGAAHRAGDRRPRRAARPLLPGDGAPVPRQGLAAADGDGRRRWRRWCCSWSRRSGVTSRASRSACAAMSRPSEMAGTMAIVGTGLVGRAWAIAFARAGWTVRLWDPDPDAAAAALAAIEGLLADLAAQEMLTVRPPPTCGRACWRWPASRRRWRVPIGCRRTRRRSSTSSRRSGPGSTAWRRRPAILASSSSAIVPSRFTEELAGRAALPGRATRSTRPI